MSGRLPLLLLVLAAPLAGQARPGARAASRPAPKAVIPTPRSVLGFDPGDDRKLADWPTLVRYYQALARASDRVDYRELGKTTLGAPLVALVISSPQNLKQLDTYRRLTDRLADPRTLHTSRDAQAAL